MVGSDAAPAGGDERTPAPGRPRVTVRRHDDRPPSMAGRVRTKGGESRPDWDTVPCRAHGSYGPGDRKAAMERREAPASFKRGCGLDGKTRCATRCSVPSALEGQGMEVRLPGAVKNTGDDACLAAYFESGLVKDSPRKG
jgi:hypothetical protein